MRSDDRARRAIARTVEHPPGPSAKGHERAEPLITHALSGRARTPRARTPPSLTRDATQQAPQAESRRAPARRRGCCAAAGTRPRGVPVLGRARSAGAAASARPRPFPRARTGSITTGAARALPRRRTGRSPSLHDPQRKAHLGRSCRPAPRRARAAAAGRRSTRTVGGRAPVVHAAAHCVAPTDEAVEQRRTVCVRARHAGTMRCRVAETEPAATTATAQRPGAKRHSAEDPHFHDAAHQRGPARRENMMMCVSTTCSLAHRFTQQQQGGGRGRARRRRAGEGAVSRPTPPRGRSQPRERVARRGPGQRPRRGRSGPGRVNLICGRRNMSTTVSAARPTSHTGAGPPPRQRPLRPWREAARPSSPRARLHAWSTAGEEVNASAGADGCRAHADRPPHQQPVARPRRDTRLLRETVMCCYYRARS